MLRAAAIQRVLPAIAVAAVLGASLLASPVGLNTKLNSVGCVTGYGGAPTVSSVTPTSGSTAGSTYVTIVGCGFTGTTAVNFGATAALGFNVVSDTQVDAGSPAHAAGTVDVTVTTPLGTSATTAADHFTYVAFAPGAPCTSATISPVNVVKQAGSGSISFHATSLGCPIPQYAFWLKYPGGTWYVKQTFSTNPTFTLSTAFFTPGHYVVRVWANEVPAARHYDAYADSSITLTGCTAAGVTGNSSSSARGVPVTFTAVSSGCTSPQYQFYIRDTAGKWHLMQGFSSSNTWSTWNNVGWAKGTYYIGVWANSPGSYQKTRQAFGIVSHILT